MTPLAWIFFGGFVGCGGLLWWVLWILTERSIALVQIARQSHLSGGTLANIARKALADTGAVAFRAAVEGK